MDDDTDYIARRERVLVNMLTWMAFGCVAGVFWREIIDLIVRLLR